MTLSVKIPEHMFEPSAVPRQRHKTRHLAKKNCQDLPVEHIAKKVNDLRTSIILISYRDLGGLKQGEGKKIC